MAPITRRHSTRFERRPAELTYKTVMAASSLPSFRGPRVQINTEKLRQHRTAAGMTQLELAYAARVTPATLSRLENGWHHPNYATVERLAQVLRIPMSELVGPSPVYRPQWRRTRGQEIVR